MNAATEHGRVWITGAGRGLGAALAAEYAAAGAHVALSARSAAQLEEVRASLPQPGCGTCFAVDVTQYEPLARTIEAIEKAGAIDLAILNAGTYAPMSVEDFSTAGFRDLFEVNVFGVIQCIELLLSPMRARGAGHIAVVASVAGDFGLPYAAPYSASKAALNRICEALRPELEREGVGISIINPGFIRTPLTDKNTFPMPFLIEPDHAAAIIRSGLSRRRFEIRFPWRMGILTRMLGMMPKSLALSLTRRMLRS